MDSTEKGEPSAESDDAAIEVVYGEPVSRCEARKMGLAGFDVDPSADGAKFFRVDELSSSAPEPDGGPAESDCSAPRRDGIPPGKGKGAERRSVFAGAAACLAVLVFLGAVAALGIIALSIFAPEQYAGLRALLPAAWTFLPRTEEERRQPPPLPPANPEKTPRTVLPSPSMKRPLPQTVAERRHAVEFKRIENTRVSVDVNIFDWDGIRSAGVFSDKG